MATQCLSTECREQFSICRGLADFTEYIAGKAQQWGDNFASIIRTTEIAKELDKTPRTVARYLTQLHDKNLATVETKRGKHGGTVVMFNKDFLNFEPTDNPITSETKEAKDIREAVFPSVPKKTPQRRYRSKAVIAEERALLARKATEQDRLNDIVENTPILTRDFFDNFDNPRLAFQGYLIAQMFTAYTVVFPKKASEFYQDIDPRRAESAQRAMKSAFNYQAMPQRFVGTPQYNKFLEMAEYFTKNDINPLSYLTVQFEYVAWLADQGKARKCGIPYVNTLLADDAKHRYYNQEAFHKEMRDKYGLFCLSSSKVPYIGAKYPIIGALIYAYNNDRTGRESIDFMLGRLKEKALMSTKNAVLLAYYTSTLQAMSESDLEAEEVAKLTQFLEEQTVNFSGIDAMTLDQFSLACPLQIYTVKSTCSRIGLSNEDYYRYIGNWSRVDCTTQDEINHWIKRGETIDFSYSGHIGFSPVMRMLADCRSLGVLPNELGGIIKKFGEEKVPLDHYGMLDINRIYEKALTKEKLHELNVEEFEMRNMMRFY